MEDIKKILPPKILESDILEKIKKKKLVSRYFMLIIALLLSSLVFNLFLVPTNIVAGGVNGIALIVKHFYNIHPSIIIFSISVILLILSYIFLGIERTSGTLIATFLYPLFVELTSNITSYIRVGTNDLIVISIFVGAIGGFANGLMYKSGFSNGGLPIISQILYKKYKIPISKTSILINGIIVIIGGIFFDFTMIMYALIILYINSFMIDKVILGTSKNKAFYIITEDLGNVEKYIIDYLGHSVTIFNVRGGFLRKKRNVLLTVIPSKEYFVMTEGIKEIDPNAFFLACDAYQVEGGK